MPTTYATPDSAHLQKFNGFHTCISVCDHLQNQEVKPANIIGHTSTLRPEQAMKSFMVSLVPGLLLLGEGAWRGMKQNFELLLLSHIPLFTCQAPGPSSSKSRRMEYCYYVLSVFLEQRPPEGRVFLHSKYTGYYQFACESARLLRCFTYHLIAKCPENGALILLV